jgi:sugar diacid utilization regulator
VGDVKRLLSATWPDGVSLAFGETAEGLEGWRLTHWQAQSAWLVALRRPQRFTHYADVALLAPWLQPDIHARWLVNTYLSPLDNQKVPGATLRTTLHHYFAAGRNASAAASGLRVSRRTMRNRMNLIELALGASVVERHQAELELALQLEQLIETDQRR